MPGATAAIVNPIVNGGFHRLRHFARVGGRHFCRAEWLNASMLHDAVETAWAVAQSVRHGVCRAIA